MMRSRVTPILLAIAGVLAALDFMMGLFRFVFEVSLPLWVVQTFHMGYERNVPSLVSAGIAAACALVLGLMIVKGKGRGHTLTWFLLAVSFVVLAFDEAFALHEYLPMYVQNIYAWLNQHVWKHTSDVAFIFPLAAGLLFALLFLRLTLTLPARTRGLVVLAGLLFASGAFLIEAAGIVSASWPLTTVEETLEMSGLIVFLHALMTYRA